MQEQGRKPQFRCSGGEMVFRQSVLAKLAVLVCIAFMAFGSHSLWRSFSTSSGVFFRVISWTIPAALIPLLVYVLNSLFAKTLVATEGIHMMSPLHRWSTVLVAAAVFAALTLWLKGPGRVVAAVLPWLIFATIYVVFRDQSWLTGMRGTGVVRVVGW